MSPLNPIANETSDVLLTCEGFGVPVPTLNWFSNNSIFEGSADDSSGSLTEFGFPLSNVSGEIEITTSSRVNDNGQMIVISQLKIIFVMKSEENISYTCVGTNGIANNINAIESISVSLTIQGTCLIN